MFRKYLLFLRTIRYLKFIQVFYQFYYRIKPVRTLDAYLIGDQNLVYNSLKFNLKLPVESSVKEDRSFTFLNLQHHFPGYIDWDYQDNGKLWNYNLQYFNYLQNVDISVDFKQHCLSDIGMWLKDGRLKLEPYPVSLRIMNSIRYFSLYDIHDRTLLNQTYAQLNYLTKNLEFHIMGNHLLENAFALMMGGHTFNELTWQKKAKKILLEQLNEQILSDGAHFELSPMYHQIILFRMLELIDWYSSIATNDNAFLNFLREKASQMLVWLRNITFKNGDIPHFNDSTFDIAFSTRELFQYAGLLNLKPQQGITLSQSGYRKYSLADYECIVDVGPIGPSYQPGHSHSDTLSFILYYKNLPLIVEMGTSTYQIGDRRNLERSTRAHNTVVIQERDQSEVWGGFRVGHRADVKIISESEIAIEASHNGYITFFGATHKRSYRFTEESINIIDLVNSSRRLKSKAYFHFYPGFEIGLSENGVVLRNVGSVTFKNASHFYIETYEVSCGFNTYKMAKVLVVEFLEKLESTIHFK